MRFEFAYQRARRTGGRGGAAARGSGRRTSTVRWSAELDRPGRHRRQVVRRASRAASSPTTLGVEGLVLPRLPVPSTREAGTAADRAPRAPRARRRSSARAAATRSAPVSDVADYLLSPAIEVHWLEDGDHDLRPRKAISGARVAQNLAEAADAVARVRAARGRLDRRRDRRVVGGHGGRVGRVQPPTAHDGEHDRRDAHRAG